jgi:hypothetical protein
MTSGDVGISIVVNAGGYVLTGATCTLLAAPGPPAAASQVQTFGPMTVSEDGLSATYVTTGRDFASGGMWSVHLQGVNGAVDFTSPAGQLFVSPRL